MTLIDIAFFFVINAFIGGSIFLLLDHIDLMLQRNPSRVYWIGIFSAVMTAWKVYNG